MSLTSYRAAPPRVNFLRARPRGALLPLREDLRRRSVGRGAGTLGCGRRGMVIVMREWGFVLGRPGNDLLSRVLRHSTIGAVEFNGRVRDGIGFGLHARVTGPAKDKGNGKRVFLWLWIAMMQRHPGRRPASATARPR